MSHKFSLIKNSSESKSVYFQMSRKFVSVRTQPAGLYQASHYMTLLKTGQKMEKNFTPPFKVLIDSEIRNPLFPTFFESPAWIGTKSFYRDLQTLGVSNIEVFPTEIQNDKGKTINNDYLLLNIVGSISCTDMKKSKVRNIGDDINLINDLVVNSANIGKFDICVVAEDTDCILVSERVANHLKLCGYKDILFKEVQQC